MRRHPQAWCGCRDSVGKGTHLQCDPKNPTRFPTHAVRTGTFLSGISTTEKDVFVGVALYMWNPSGRGHFFQGVARRKYMCLNELHGTCGAHRGEDIPFRESPHGKMCVCKGCKTPGQCHRARRQRVHTAEDRLPHYEARKWWRERERSVHIP